MECVSLCAWHFLSVFFVSQCMHWAIPTSARFRFRNLFMKTCIIICVMNELIIAVFDVSKSKWWNVLHLCYYIFCIIIHTHYLLYSCNCRNISCICWNHLFYCPYLYHYFDCHFLSKKTERNCWTSRFYLWTNWYASSTYSSSSTSTTPTTSNTCARQSIVCESWFNW